MAQPKVNPSELNKLMDEAGVGSRTRKKLVEANEGEEEKPEKPARGHGTAVSHTPERF